jgi:hypothetical protein
MYLNVVIQQIVVLLISSQVNDYTALVNLIKFGSLHSVWQTARLVLAPTPAKGSTHKNGPGANIIKLNFYRLFPQNLQDSIIH